MRTHLIAFAIIFAVTLAVAPVANAIVLTPNYIYSVGDAITGDNFVSGEGWYVSPGADEYNNDFIRERPLGNQDFGSVNDGGISRWVHPGQYYSYLDIVSARWGYDDQYMYFEQTLYGNWFQSDAGSDRDYGAFGSGTTYNILLGDKGLLDATGSILLRVLGDSNETWTGPSGEFLPKASEGYYDRNKDVGGSGVDVTKDEGDSAGNGYEDQVILSDGYIDDSNNPQILFSRITGADLDDDSRPIVEIAFNYSLWNSYATDLLLPLITPANINMLVFEANRGIKADENYLWNDKYTQNSEGNPYNIDGQDQLGDVYELDRTYWPAPTTTTQTPVPEPSTMILLGAGLTALFAYAYRRRHTQ